MGPPKAEVSFYCDLILRFTVASSRFTKKYGIEVVFK